MRTRRWLPVLVAALLAGCAAAPAGAPEPPASPSPRVTVTAPSPNIATPAASQVVPRRPALAVLPDGTRMPVDVAGTTTVGALRVPDDVTHAGWWEGGSRLGDRFGSVVLAAHVDSRTQGLGPAASLLGAGPGDVLVLAAGRSRQRFAVVSVSRVARDRLSERHDLFSARGELRLVFLTCGGPFDPARGYRDNVVVLARPVA